MAYEDFIDLHRRTAWALLLRNKANNIAKNLLKLQVQNPGLASIVCKWFDKNPAMYADKSA